MFENIVGYQQGERVFIEGPRYKVRFNSCKKCSLSTEHGSYDDQAQEVAPFLLFVGLQGLQPLFAVSNCCNQNPLFAQQKLGGQSQHRILH